MEWPCDLQLIGIIEDMVLPFRIFELDRGVQIMVYDQLPDNLKQLVSLDFVRLLASAPTAQAELEAYAAKYSGGATAPVMTENFLRSDYESFVDPHISQHFLVVSGTCESSAQNILAEENVWARAEIAMAAVRLVARSSASLVDATLSKNWSDGQCVRGSNQRGAELRAVGKKPRPTVVPQEQLEEIKKVFTGIIRTPELMLPVRRLNQSLTRFTAADRLLDLVIALEGLFLPDGNAELVYRLRMRAAVTLGSTFDERAKISQGVKALYKARSDIVHGNATVNMEKNLKQLGGVQGAIRTSRRWLAQALILELRRDREISREDYYDGLLLS